jgi:hypothetical protein
MLLPTRRLNPECRQQLKQQSQQGCKHLHGQAQQKQVEERQPQEQQQHWRWSKRLDHNCSDQQRQQHQQQKAHCCNLEKGVDPTSATCSSINQLQWGSEQHAAAAALEGAVVIGVPPLLFKVDDASMLRQTHACVGAYLRDLNMQQVGAFLFTGTLWDCTYWYH